MEALLPGLGWVGLDPTNNLMACDRHIRTAIGRDYATSLRTLDDLVAAIRRACLDWQAAGAPAAKLSQSYHRRMDFAERRHADA